MKCRLPTITGLVVAAIVVGIAGAPAARSAPVIQPGASITMGGSFCTLNWIYDGGGTAYAGTAGHCVDGVGQRVSLASGSLGEAILEFGTVAFVSPNLDYALIAIDGEDQSLVDPSLKGHPNIPTGVSTTATAAPGDVIQFSGHGVGFHLLPATQESRVGILHSNDGSQHYVIGAVSPGDSGGPVADVTDGNKALGIVNTVGAGINGLPYLGEGGVSLDGMFADAASFGFTVQLRTV